MEQFPHLKFVQKLIGRPRLFGGGKLSEATKYNKDHRHEHSENLIRTTSKIKTTWSKTLASRDRGDLAPLDSTVIPIFLQIDPDLLNADFDLQAFGIEIISEEENGFIVGASVDNLRSLDEKINGFINAEHGSGKIADLWQIIDGNNEDWKPQHILSTALLEKWAQIEDNVQYPVEVSIAFDKPLGAEPGTEKRGGIVRLEKYRKEQEERDERLRQRQTSFENFIRYYGEITSGIVELEDCFGCEVIISGKGLKDLVANYPFVFEVNELERIGGVTGGVGETENSDLVILAPEENAPIVGVIDSGLMQNHKFLEIAIDAYSKSYLFEDDSVADNVKGGGHGTRVAGAILYPLGVSKYQSPYQLPCYIRNLRILDKNNKLLHRYPAELLRKIIEDNDDCSIFNLSVNSTIPYRRRHMSTWAACLDQAMFDKNVLFVISAGNIHRNTIKDYIAAGKIYPHFLEEPFCNIANPGQSCFAITVGSINHATFEDESWESLGDKLNVSAFSRIGPGIWGTVKPDIVEFGGGLVVSKNGLNQIKESKATAPELLRSTLHGGSFNSSDTVGTSFAAPKATHIISNLKRLYPSETVNLLRALLVQGARLPNDYFLNPTEASIKSLGYGVPSLERVIQNTDYRVSFYNTANIRAEEGHIYSLKIPDSMRNPGDEYDILIEVTLAYTAKIRRTRQKVKSYLSTWLDWSNSKLGESFESYKDFALKEIEGEVTQYDNAARKQLTGINWKIGERNNGGDVRKFTRGNNSIQKDWAIIKSHELPEEISFVTRGHKGWDKNRDEVPYAFVVSLEILGNNIPIYESIRIENENEIRLEND
ncbi:S8 family peptidase [Arachidicoccus soli]|uniref:Peptidase n=1 Tax=Arachidicoccus soli TaxID=2341117 RepID=A0A386HKX8_9BACT|nr:S8 family peptidase [Arachidicoccus soli]AYD46393.1 peptidase [Arachidicoccus soli]